MQKHVHAELIIAWGNGATIQFARYDGEWIDCKDNNPSWNNLTKYRVNPQDAVRYGVLRYDFKDSAICAIIDYVGNVNGQPDNNVKMTFDSTTGVLKSIEKIN